jgi:hypothetical protein
MKHRIIEKVYVDHYGKEHNKHYYIQTQKEFLGFKYWKTLKHTECGWGDCYKATTKFAEHKDAVKHIKEVLCLGIKTDAHKETIYDYQQCEQLKK